MSSIIKFNDKVKLIISDVDETIADLYVNASAEMIRELEKLLLEGRILFFISGQSVQSVQKRITNHINKKLRKQIIVGHCSGAEGWGFDKEGQLLQSPFYSLYKNLANSQKRKWRAIIQELIREFKLEVFPTMPIS